MNKFHLFFKICLILWPIIIALQAFVYRRKQSSSNPFTGGPISWPKAFWLSYTIWTWFLLPFVFIFHPLLSDSFKVILIFHLISWWSRGLLELIMIYKWFNWSPKYGITHDLFHFILIAVLLWFYRFEVFSSIIGNVNYLVMFYLLMLFISTSAEIVFAKMFMEFRSKTEEESNIYFASDEEKWTKINRITLIVVLMVYFHLIFQSVYTIYFL